MKLAVDEQDSDTSHKSTASALHANYPLASTTPGIWKRLAVAADILAHFRMQDVRAAGTFSATQLKGNRLVRFARMAYWGLHQLLVVIPPAMTNIKWRRPVSRVPIWLSEGNPFANHPWANDSTARLPETVDTLVIGAGFTGAAAAYHWAKHAADDRTLAVLEMDDPASGASGRNAGTVVMGRYYANVYNTVRQHLPISRPDLAAGDRDRLARKFAAAYASAAYKNAELIESTIRGEGFDCDYVRQGWVSFRGEEEQASLDAAVQMAQETGFDDWVKLTAEDAALRTGANTKLPCAMSRGAAMFHPAKWVWSLLTAALRRPNVKLYTRTKVLNIEDGKDYYTVRTSRGVIRARHILNALESYAPLLHPQLHDVVRPVQTQIAFGAEGPAEMQPHVSISSTTAFYHRTDHGLLFGSDETRVPDHCAGQNKPSRFISAFVLGELRNWYRAFATTVTHEWSGTVGFTPDQYPIVGLLDNKRQYIIGGMCGSGTGVSFNAARNVVQHILTGAWEDYPPEFFAPSRLLSPKTHRWPQTEE